MLLILISLITGFIGMMFGSYVGGEASMFFWGFFGIISPALFVLEKIYMKFGG
ncbi:hypothetical protein [Natranaerobius thermophilus]|uniref:Uncharacterized protein n=1 Tax=Natranaerobius thermophilus (strain ATCC BAA-1301 / DSM 18059 / JW/NM-WN-LF) TaxID=457570 RepID=B2A1U1_NATTJ|nr:hypothetical protein [Natranaerobius thermophilus]ACB86138.1 hypothetical protein Nther_2580 [Natranaerobius thermophilus JW/NM-WN-LF]